MERIKKASEASNTFLDLTKKYLGKLYRGGLDFQALLQSCGS